MKKRNFLIALLIAVCAGLSCSYVFILASEECPEPNSHQVDDQCYCDTYYKAEGGQCVKMSESEICPFANSHQVGDQCVCDDGYGAASGSKECVSKNALCASYNAHYNAAIDDCDCNEGYIINDAGNNCLPAPAEAESNTNISIPLPVNINIEQKDINVIIDPVDIMIDLKEDPSVNLSVQPLIDVSLENATEDEIKTVDDQKKSINSLLSFNEDIVELMPTDEQKMELARTIITEKVKGDLNAWDLKVKAAETAGDVKDKNDKEKFEQLKREEKSIEQQIKDNQTALAVMHKQNLGVMYNNEAWIANMYTNDVEYQQTPKRDFMKEANGDQGIALVYATQAISAQHKLLEELKDNLRAKKDEKMNLLDIPAKPDLEKELEKMKVDWYKQ